MVSEEELLDIIDRLRVSVPEDIREARQLIQQRDGIMEEALVQAKKITGAAEEEFKARLRESELVRAAQASAHQILSESERKAETVLADAERVARTRKEDADGYTLEVLRKLDEQLSAFLASVRKGIEALGEGKKR
jgi:vacuolar-type H+-ATPase subunit H